jgi:acylglycerol lipase
VHGYGCCTARHAFLARQFAENGYEFCGIDQLGFGLSGG